MKYSVQKYMIWDTSTVYAVWLDMLTVCRSVIWSVTGMQSASMRKMCISCKIKKVQKTGCSTMDTSRPQGCIGDVAEEVYWR